MKAPALLARADHDYDEAARTRRYFEARRLIAGEAPDIPLVHRDEIYALRDNLSGFHSNGETIFDDIMDLDVQ